MSEMHASKDCKQQRQQRCDAGKAEDVEIANSDVRKRCPSPKTDGCNEKAGDSEEHLNPELTIPNQQVCELLREKLRVEHLRTEQTNVYVIHQYEKDREPTQQIYSV